MVQGESSEYRGLSTGFYVKDMIVFSLKKYKAHTQNPNNKKIPKGSKFQFTRKV